MFQGLIDCVNLRPYRANATHPRSKNKAMFGSRKEVEPV